MTTTTSKWPARTFKPFLPALLAAIPLSTFAALLWSAARLGPDWPWYLQWSDAALGSNMFELQSDVASPQGLPLMLAAHGVGFVFAVGRLFTEGWLSPVNGAVFAGFAMAIVAWWAMADLLFKASKSAGATAACLAVGFIGTHLGFYTLSHASESFSIALVAVLGVVLVHRDTDNWRTAALAGVSTALLVTVRSYLVVYAAAPCLAVLLTTLQSARRGRRPWWRASMVAALVIVPPLLGVLQILGVNAWMTGSPFRSPYVFGNAEFRSMDLSRPDFVTIFTHPWHGLLVYHPLYLVAGLATATAVWRQRHQLDLRWVGLVAAATAIHVWLQASYFCWWLGTGTFGMRGLAVLGVVLLPGLAWTLNAERGWRRVFWLAPCTGCCLWSLALHVQHESNFLTFGPLLAAQRAVLLRPSLWTGLAAAGLAGVVSSRLWRREPGWPTVVAPFAALATLALALDTITYRELPIQHGVGNAAIALAFLGGVGGAGLASLPPRSTASRVVPASLTVIGVFFLITTAMFLRLFSATEQYLAESHSLPARFTAQSTVLLPEVVATLDEYNTVPGFEERKAEYKQFVDEAVSKAAIKAR
ncbi:MAG: hypothetical protein HY903_03155 [Deltaproteobacteria bacterium]|nr:hypothetical protein [Deltaproteobacteria bacterium]